MIDLTYILKYDKYYRTIIVHYLWTQVSYDYNIKLIKCCVAATLLRYLFNLLTIKYILYHDDTLQLYI